MRFPNSFSWQVLLLVLYIRLLQYEGLVSYLVVRPYLEANLPAFLDDIRVK